MLISAIKRNKISIAQLAFQIQRVKSTVNQVF